MREGQPHAYTPLLPLRKTGTRRPLFCVHPAGGMATSCRTLTDHLDPGLPVRGLQALGLEAPEHPRGSIDEMAQTYVEAVQAVKSTGPYYLLGWSLGGRIAHAMAVWCHGPVEMGMPTGFPIENEESKVDRSVPTGML